MDSVFFIDLFNRFVETFTHNPRRHHSLLINCFSDRNLGKKQTGKYKINLGHAGVYREKRSVSLHFPSLPQDKTANLINTLFFDWVSHPNSEFHI